MGSVGVMAVRYEYVLTGYGKRLESHEPPGGIQIARSNAVSWWLPANSMWVGTLCRTTNSKYSSSSGQRPLRQL